MSNERPKLTRNNATDEPAHQSDGVITDEVSQDEAEFVADALQYLDTVEEDARQNELPSEEEGGEESQPQPVVAAPVQPPIAPQGEQIQQIVQPPAQAAVPAAPQAPATAQPQTPAVQPGQEFDRLVQAMEQNREQVIGQIANSYEGTFTDQDIENFQSPDPKVARKTLAAMAGRLQVDIVQNILGVVAKNMPGMVNGLVGAQRTNAEAEAAFYGANPDLVAHKAEVLQVAAGIRAANPNMPNDQFGAVIAATVRNMKGLQPQAPAKAPAQRKPKGGFRPAPSAGRPNAAPAGQGNYWGQLSEIVDGSDQGAFDR